MLGDERSNGCNDQYDAWNPQGVALCENRGSGKGHDAPVLDARETLHHMTFGPREPQTSRKRLSGALNTPIQKPPRSI